MSGLAACVLFPLFLQRGLCTGNDTALDAILSVYGYGLSLEPKRPLDMDDPLLHRFEEKQSQCKLDGHEVDAASECRMRAESARDTMESMQDECIDAIGEMFRSHRYYNLDSNPLLVAAEELGMEWLTGLFGESLRMRCIDGEVFEKRWVLEKLDYFSATCRINPCIDGVYTIDWEEYYGTEAIKTFLGIVRGEMLQKSIGYDAFYELLEFTHSNIYEDDVKAKLYSGLVTHGLLGEHSGDITGTGPEEIKQAMDAIEPRWWYTMLVLAASEFGIGMTIDDTTVELSSGRRCSNLAGIDVTGIKTLRYGMCIDLDRKVRHVALSDVLMFIFDRLGSISELVLVGELREDLDTDVFDKVFASLSGVMKLGFVSMAESSFRKIVSTLDLTNIKELDTSDTVFTGNFSFVEKLVSLERLRIRIRG